MNKNKDPFIKAVRRAAVTFTGLALAASTGLIMAAPSNAADGDFKFTVVAKDLSYGEASFSIKDRERLTVNGATQLTWWHPNHNVKVTKASLKKAPRLTIKYKACSKQSKSIAKQARGESIVIAKPGSVICNTGKNGNIVGGFKWTVKVPAVLKWNKRLKLYEHVYNIVNGKLVKTCRNRMGGHVDVMYPSVVQVQYEQDVKESATADASAEVGGTVTFKVTCPSGAWFNTTVTTKAEANASAEIEFTQRTLVSVLAAKEVELRHDLRADGDVDAVAKAETKIEVEGNCGSTPPPATPKAVVSVDQLNDIDETDPKCLEEYDNPTAARVACESWTVFQAHVTVPDGVSGTLRVDSLYGVTAFSKGTPADFSDDVKSVQLGSGQSDPEIRYGAPTEVPAGGYDTITVTFTPAGGGDSVQATTRIKINETPVPPM